MEKDTVTFVRGFKCWGACITSALLQAVSIGMSNSYGVIMEVKAFLHGSDFAHTYVGGIFKYLTNIA